MQETPNFPLLHGYLPQADSFFKLSNNNIQNDNCNSINDGYFMKQ